MCLLKSILAIQLINGNTFVSASPSTARLLFRDIKEAKVAFQVAWGEGLVVNCCESRDPLVSLQPVNMEVK